MPGPVVERATLRHNPANEVTESVERVTLTDGRTVIRKRLRRPGPSAGQWAASEDPRHWNYWHREADVYADDGLRRDLAAAGLDLPTAEIDEDERGVTLWLEDVAGTAGVDFTLADHRALAAGLGRWQSGRPFDRPWASQRFLRDYSGSKPVAVDTDTLWSLPLIRAAWSADLRTRWTELVAHRQRLLALMEDLPRVPSHLDAWVSNELRRPDGRVVMVDWAFCGDGALGEDVGNHVPDAVFDLFWPVERLAELDAACFDAYLDGLGQAGWVGDPAQARLGMVASCVKYTWLVPLMLERASSSAHEAYGVVTDSFDLYRTRGLVFEHLLGWFDEARRLEPRL